MVCEYITITLELDFEVKSLSVIIYILLKFSTYWFEFFDSKEYKKINWIDVRNIYSWFWLDLFIIQIFMIEKKLFKESYLLFQRSFLRTFSYTILLRIFYSILLSPIFLAVFNLLLKTKWVDFIGNRDMLWFFFSIYGLILIPLSLLVILIMMSFELWWLTLIIDSFLLGKKIDNKSLLKEIFKSIKTITKKGLFKFLFFSLLLLPLSFICVYFFVNIFLLFWSMQKFSIDFLEILILFWIIFLIMLFVYYFFIKRIFAIHIVYLKKQTFEQAILQSKFLTQKSFKSIFISMVLRIVMIVLPFLLINLWINATIDYIIPSGNISNNILMMSSFLAFLELIINGVYGIVVSPFILSFITILYYSYVQNKLWEKVVFAKYSKNKNLLVLLLIVLSVLIITLGWSCVIYLLTKDEIESLDKKIYITAHRWSSGLAPQNTLSAINLAIQDKSDFVEFDVQETKDGIVVLMHDENVKKTSGVNRNIWDMSYSEVESLDVWSFFSQEFKWEKVPTLWEVLDAWRWKIKMLIEIKEYWHGKNIIESVNNLIKEKCIPWDCLIHSTDYKVLEKMKKVNPSIKLWYILTAWVWNFFKLDVDFFSVPSSMLGEDFLANVSENNKELWIWTLNDKENIDDMIALWVDNIITDYPLLGKENIDYRNDLSDSEKLKIKIFKLINN